MDRVDCDSNSDVFCLNGGFCSQEDELVCQCVDGYSGSNCEVEPSVCSLECQNGGSCVFGDVPYNFNWPGNKTELGMHCSCPKGFGGFYCEYFADICGSYDHVCLHGQRCVEDSDRELYSCECAKGDRNCQEKQKTSYCLPSSDLALAGVDVPEYFGGMAVPAFCMHGGKCKAILVDGEWHSGCECLPLFTGPHCEFVRSSSEIIAAGSGIYGSNRRYMNRATISFLTGLLSIFVIGLLFAVRQIRRVLSRSNEATTEINLQGFRDKIEEEEERQIGAFSPNGNMLFPAFGGGRGRGGRGFDPDDVMVLSEVDLT